MSLLPFAGWEVLPHERSELFVRRKLSFRHSRLDYEFFDCPVVTHMSLKKKPHNGGVDAAARIKTPFAALSKLRNTPPPLASNDLFDVPFKNYTQRTLSLK